MQILNENPALATLVNNVAEVAGYLWQKGWAERNGGNITVNVTSVMDKKYLTTPPLSDAIALDEPLPRLANHFFYAKGTGKRMRDLARHPMENGCIIRICPDGAHYEIVADQMVRPTSELSSHLLIQDYMLAQGYNYPVTIHTHPIELVAMTHNRAFLDSERLTRLLWSMIPETLAFAPLGVGVVPYERPGSVKLANATLDLIKHHDVVLWEKHGAFATGEDIFDAFDQIDVLNKAAQIYMCSKNMGFEPEGMTDDAMQEVRTVFHLPDERAK